MPASPAHSLSTRFNHELDPRQASGVFRKTSDHIRSPTIAGDGGTTEAPRAMDEHPLFAWDRGWLAAGKLLPGDRLRQPDGSWQEMLSSERETRPDGIVTWLPALS